MKLRIEYGRLHDCINIIDMLKLSGIDSIRRTRLNNILRKKLSVIAEEQLELDKQFCKLGEDGMPIVSRDTVEDEDGFKEARVAFLKEEIVIDDGESQELLKCLRKYLEESGVVWEDSDIYNFEYLYSAIED